MRTRVNGMGEPAREAERRDRKTGRRQNADAAATARVSAR
jgi:hypothetical protein